MAQLLYENIRVYLLQINLELALAASNDSRGRNKKYQLTGLNNKVISNLTLPIDPLDSGGPEI